MSRLDFQPDLLIVVWEIKVKEVAAAKAVVVVEVNMTAVIEAKVEITACQIIKIPDTKKQWQKQ